MAISTCKECGREVSTLAKTCPGCGVSNPGKVTKQKKEKSISKSSSESKIDVNKGSKRVFYILATIWGLFIYVMLAVRWDACIPYPGWIPPLYCETSFSYKLLEGFIFWVISSAVVYFLFKWIGAGFKKKK